uniref:Uncharacterized protein ycf35 n=1 Tax=Halydictyon mirabile TaxID=189652 RepID=A0A4D6WZ48_9FLOR|nr:hypothetical protein [Halydictyon mirabile]
MSHFSKINTNISNLKILQKTLSDFGFITVLNGNHDILKLKYSNIMVYKDNKCSKPICNFSWDGKEYNLVVDISLWNLDCSLDYFLEKLNQNYALNIINQEVIASGFHKSIKEVMNDGSIKLVVQKWIN